MKIITIMTKDDCIETDPYDVADLTGLILVMDINALFEKYKNAKYQLVRSKGGFGARRDAMGNAMYLTFLADGECARFERCNHPILGIATNEAIEEWKRLYGEFVEEETT